MAGLYVDTSALGRVLLGESDASAIRATVANYEDRWASELLIVELRRLGARTNAAGAAEALLAGVHLVPLDRGTLERSSRLEPFEVRSLDAIHLDAARQLHRSGVVEAMLTFDRQLAAGCRHHGLRVEQPT